MSPHAPQIRVLMERYGIALFEFREGDVALNLRRAAAEPVEKTVVRAPAFGRLLFAHPATAERPALPRRVKAGDIVAYLAVGPVLRAVTAETDCTLQRALKPEGAIAGYGDPIFET